MSNFTIHNEKPFELSPELSKRYHGERYISRMPFLINESVEVEPSATRIREDHIPNNAVFMGIAGFRSLDLLSIIGETSNSGYKQAILFDNNEAQRKAMNIVLRTIKHCRKPEQFCNMFLEEYPTMLNHVPRRKLSETAKQNMSKNDDHPFFDQIREDKNYFGAIGKGFNLQTKEELSDYLSGAIKNRNSFLYPENYQRIRDLVTRDRVTAITLDLTDTQRFNILKNDLEKMNLKVVDAYVSTSLMFLSGKQNQGYHIKESTIGKNVKFDTAIANIESLGTVGRTRYLYSHHTKEGHGFYLIPIKAEQVRELGSKREEFLNRAENQHVHSRYIGLGKRTVEIHSDRKIHMVLKNSIGETLQHADDDDVIVSAHFPKEGSFSENETKTIIATFLKFTDNPLAAIDHLNSPRSPIQCMNLRDGSTDIEYINLHIPKEKCAQDPELPERIVNSLEKTIQSLRPIMSR